MKRCLLLCAQFRIIQCVELVVKLIHKGQVNWRIRRFGLGDLLLDFAAGQTAFLVLCIEFGHLFRCLQPCNEHKYAFQRLGIIAAIVLYLSRELVQREDVGKG
jgi:hypothetical protein